MTSRKPENLGHMPLPCWVRTDCRTTVGFRTQELRGYDADRFLDAHRAIHSGTAQHFEFARSVRSISSRSCVALSGSVPCMELQSSYPQRPRKPPVRIGGRPTNLSAMCFPISANAFFGLKTQRRTSRRRQVAACGRPSGISAATNGPAMPWPQYSKKFSIVEKCGT